MKPANTFDTVSAVSVAAREEAVTVEASRQANNRPGKGLNNDLRVVRRRRFDPNAAGRDSESSHTLHRVASQLSKGMQTSSHMKNLNFATGDQVSRAGVESALSTKEASRPQPPSSSGHGRASDVRSILLMKSQFKRRTAHALH